MGEAFFGSSLKRRTIMFRKAFISLVAVATIGTGIASMTSAADAHRRHHRSHISLGFVPFFGFPGYGYGDRYAFYDDYGYEDCGYRRVKVKRWNKAHTRRIVVYKKRWVCH
jgi:hypothetical protein